MEKLPILLLWFVPFIFSLSFHEAAHAWMANRKGDPTARLMGRMTLNPAAHVDPLGTIIFPILAFFTHLPLIGWAKPVPVNELNLKNWRKDGIWVAAAGPLSNLFLALCFTGLVYIIQRFPRSEGIVEAGFMIREPILSMAVVGIQFNLILAFFNLIPFPPLDGGRVAAGIFPAFGRWMSSLGPMAMIVLYMLMFSGILNIVVFRPANLIFAELMRIAS